MPTPVHLLARRPLTSAAVAELVALPAGPPVADDVDALDAELTRRGWAWEHERVCDSFLTGHGHVICSDGRNPFGRADVPTFLVFGELYPVDEEDEDLRNLPWLHPYMDLWARTPGWEFGEPSTAEECEATLTRAARAVTEHLGAGPERVVLSDVTVVTGPAMTHRVWRTPTHALVLGPSADNGPYGYLTHLQLSFTPLDRAPGLPPADDEDALIAWIADHVDW